MTTESTFAHYVARLDEFIRRAGGGFEQLFNDLALELFALQFAHNAPYGRFCRTQDATPRTVRDWTEIPAVPAAAFKDFELTSLPPAQRTTVFHSSGTTAHCPSRHFHDAESLAVYAASVWSWFAAHLLGKTTASVALCCLTPSPAFAPHSSLVHMFEVVRRALGAPASAFVGRPDDRGGWTLAAEAAIRLLQRSEGDQTPLLILGTAFSFVHLLDALRERRRTFQLAPGSRAMETGGYKGRSRAVPKVELHASISQRLGIPGPDIVCEYGMSELSSQAYDTVSGSAGGSRSERLFRFPPWARIRIVSPETAQEVADGETGLIRVCDLANVRSVMAIQTEDLGIRRGEDFTLIGRAVLAEARGCSLMESHLSPRT